MPRLLAHLLLLLYAGIFLHCQPLPARAASIGSAGSAPQEQSRTGQCKKKQQTVQASPQADRAQVVKAKLPPLDLALGDFTTVDFGVLFPFCGSTGISGRNSAAGPRQVFANHRNKAPPIRCS